jgi:hypothetical protein
MNSQVVVTPLANKQGLRRHSDLRSFHAVLYTHLFCVCCTAAASLVDGGLLRIDPEWREQVFGGLLLVGFPGFLCPIAMAICACGARHRSIAFRMSAVGGDIGLWWFQAWALLPTVQ